MNYIEVTYDEFSNFLKNYANKLEWNCVTICDPPIGFYHDFTDFKEGDHPLDYVVAKIEYPYYPDKDKKYFIKVG